MQVCDKLNCFGGLISPLKLVRLPEVCVWQLRVKNMCMNLCVCVCVCVCVYEGE